MVSLLQQPTRTGSKSAVRSTQFGPLIIPPLLLAGVLSSPIFIESIMGPGVKAISSSRTSLITSILSAGTFFGRSPALPRWALSSYI